MRARSSRPLPLVLAPAALVAVIALAGCGKSLGVAANGEGGGAVTFVGASGAGGLTTSNTTRLGGSNPVSDAAAVARAVHSGLTSATRPQTVVLVDRNNWPGALAAAVLASAPLGAPLLYTDGEQLPAASADALAAMRPRGSGLLGGVQTIELGESASPSGYHTEELGGKSPYVLAVNVERLVSRIQGDVSPAAVIVVAADGPRSFAMPAAGLAAESGAPILFTRRDSIPGATRAALSQLHSPRIYAIGPSSAISAGVLARLSRFGAVRRLQGSTAAQNAIAVSRYADGSFGWGVDEPGHGLVFASSSRPFDAPAAASLSASGDYGPLLLLERPDQVPAALADYLNGIKPGYGSAPEYGPVRTVYNHGWLIGDETSISAQVQGELDSMLEASLRNVPTSQPSVGP